MVFSRNKIWMVLVLTGLVLIGATPPLAQVAEDEKVILVDLRVATPDDARKAYSDQFDHKRVELSLGIDDPLNTLEDYSLGERPLEGPGCFMPDLKVIFRTHTYVFSLYCTEVKKYRNSAPYTPSAKTVQNDIRFTQSVLDVLEEIREKYFGDYFDPKIAQRFVKDLKLDKVDDKVDDSQLYEEEKDEADKKLEQDAIDNEGWFEEDKDPELEEDETSDEDENDDGQ